MEHESAKESNVEQNEYSDHEGEQEEEVEKEKEDSNQESEGEDEFKVEYENNSVQEDYQPPQQPQNEEKPQQSSQFPPNQPEIKKEQSAIISEQDKQWIIKEAKMQRIGGTYDFFAANMQKYRKHLDSRKNAYESIYSYIERNKVTKAKTVILLKDYFKDYAEICADFHQKSYKYQIPKRQEVNNPMINVRMELRQGFQGLFAMRREVGNEHSRINKLIKTNILSKLSKAMDIYWGSTAKAQKKVQDKFIKCKDKEESVMKRTQKISKVYQKGRYGQQQGQDVFVQMTKYIKQERQLRALIYDWSKQLISLRKSIMQAEYSLMSTFESILAEYKHFNDSVFQLKKKKTNFQQQLKDQIQKRYRFQNMCTPVDNDYVLAILNFKRRQSIGLLKQKDYEQFLGQQYFQFIIGDLKEVLKGTVKKVFPLKNGDEELVQSVTNNFVFYNKKTLQVKNKLIVTNTHAVFKGMGQVALVEKVKGIIFDSENTQVIKFSSNDRAQELVLAIENQLQIKDNQNVT